MKDLEYIEKLFEKYRNEVLGLSAFGRNVNKSKVKRLGIELRQEMVKYEQKNYI